MSINPKWQTLNNRPSSRKKADYIVWNMSMIYIQMLICKLWILEGKNNKYYVYGAVYKVDSVPYIPTRVTRAGNGIAIQLPIPRTELFKKSVSYKGSKVWNDLNEDIRNITELNEFKKNITAVYPK